jgi:hypothetical protein
LNESHSLSLPRRQTRQVCEASACFNLLSLIEVQKNNTNKPKQHKQTTHTNSQASCGEVKQLKSLSASTTQNQPKQISQISLNKRKQTDNTTQPKQHQHTTQICLVRKGKGGTRKRILAKKKKLLRKRAPETSPAAES